MSITVLATREIFDHALEEAYRARTAPAVSGLAAPLQGAVLGRIEEAWDRISEALEEGFEFGKDKAQSTLDSVLAQVERLMSDAGEQAGEVKEALLGRMQVFLQEFIKGAISRVPASIEVGELRFHLVGLKCTQSLVTTGSLKVNLIELLTLTANGEFQISTDYALESKQ